jgi:hypothetical protein
LRVLPARSALLARASVFFSGIFNCDDGDVCTATL